ncbi:hypothetical protein [Mastigocoleus testarum]|uniref:hypothetical protein n=1 Tax=Mastigocoleus testarum TaxID=996925 RepID=UPI001F299D69|nr:hypothetical protein [Mastigocoleus testarum]
MPDRNWQSLLSKVLVVNRLMRLMKSSCLIYYKRGKWIAAVQFTPALLKRASQHSTYSSIDIDTNPNSIGWAYVDFNRNLKTHG